MRFSTLIPAFCLLASRVAAVATADAALLAAHQTAQGISAGNCYGAPIYPWLPGCYPGWYYGEPQYAPSGLACLVKGVMVFPIFF